MEPTYQDFLDACRVGDLETVQRALVVLSIEDIISNYNEGFRIAASYGHLNVVNHLLEIDKVLADATVQDNYALTAATYAGNLNLVNRLLEIPTVRENAAVKNNMVLRIAVKQGYLNVVNRLLEIPAVLENATALNNEVLRNAVEFSRHDVATRLLQEKNVADYLKLHQQDFIEQNKTFFKKIEDRRFDRILMARTLFNACRDELMAKQVRIESPEDEASTRTPYAERQILTYLYHDVLCGKSACLERKKEDSFFKCPIISQFRDDALGAKARAQAKVAQQNANSVSTSTNSSMEPSKKARIN